MGVIAGTSHRPTLWASRPAADNARLIAAIHAAGALALDLPLLQIVTETLPAIVPTGDDLWFFTSRAAARAVVMAGWLEKPPLPCLLAVGPGTAAELAAGFDGLTQAPPAIILPPHDSGALALLAHPILGNIAGRRARVFSGHRPLPDLESELARRGATVTFMPTHHRRALHHAPNRLRQAIDQADALLLTSRTALEALGGDFPRHFPVATASARIAAAAREAGFTRVGTADGPLTDAALVASAVALLHNVPGHPAPRAAWPPP